MASAAAANEYERKASGASYLHGLLARRLSLVVLGLLVLLAALGQVGIVGQAAEEGRHHGAGVHFLLRRQKQEGRGSER